MKVYRLTAENIVDVGRMGGSTYIEWEKFFTSVNKAKKYGKKAYKGANDWEWVKDGTGFSSGDLGFVMYDIKLLKLEK